MSHIAFDLDALPLVPKVARSAGINEAVVGWGLTQMWEWCWREKTDHVTTNHLRGFFGAEIGAILCDFGFLEAVGSSLWRVRGAARYLRISQARSEGGKKSRSNLKQYRQPEESTGSPTGSPPAHLRLEPEATRSDGTGSTATSDERLATSDERKNAGPRKKKEPKPPDPRHQPMVVELTAIFERETGAKYPFSPIDAAAVTALLTKGVDPTITAAWTRALRHTGFPTVRTLAELVKHFAHFVGRDATAPPRESPREHTEGRVFL